MGKVTIMGNKPTGLAAKGKEKETYDGVVAKGKGVTTRQPLHNLEDLGMCLWPHHMLLKASKLRKHGGSRNKENGKGRTPT